MSSIIETVTHFFLTSRSLPAETLGDEGVRGGHTPATGEGAGAGEGAGGGAGCCGVPGQALTSSCTYPCPR